MQFLAVEVDVAAVKLLLPRLRLVLVEDRHPALGKSERVEVVRKLPVGVVARKVLRRLHLHGVTLVAVLHAEVEALRSKGLSLQGNGRNPSQLCGAWNRVSNPLLPGNTALRRGRESLLRKRP